MWFSVLFPYWHWLNIAFIFLSSFRPPLTTTRRFIIYLPHVRKNMDYCLSLLSLFHLIQCLSVPPILLWMTGLHILHDWIIFYLSIICLSLIKESLLYHSFMVAIYFLVLAIVNKSINKHKCWSISLRFISFRQYPCASLTLLCENIHDKLLGTMFIVAYSSSSSIIQSSMALPLDQWWGRTSM